MSDLVVFVGPNIIDYMRDRKSYFDKNAKTIPGAGRRREHGRGCLRQSRKRRARRDTSSKHHPKWWNLSIAETTGPTYLNMHYTTPKRKNPININNTISRHELVFTFKAHDILRRHRDRCLQDLVLVAH